MVHKGRAYVRFYHNNQYKDYDIEITSLNNSNSKNISFKVTSDELLDMTNGIVQGMSGCPIIQDGRIIGAVTHVLIDDSRSGYGIYIENMFDMDDYLLKKLAIKMDNEPRFGVCLDVAHAFIGTQPLNEWFYDLSPYIRHLHINDNNGIEDSHNPVGSMDVPWNLYRDYIQSLPSEKLPSVLIEVNDYDDLVSSVEYMKDNKLYPF